MSKSELVDQLASRVGTEDTGTTSPRSPTLKRTARELDIDSPYGGAESTRRKLRERMGKKPSGKPLRKSELEELIALLDRERNGWYSNTNGDDS